MTSDSTTAAQGTRCRWLAVLAAAAALGALLMLAGGVDLLVSAQSGGATGGFEDLTAAIDRVKGPATVALGALSTTGILAGGAMLAVGMQQGMRIMTMSAGTLGAVALGNGVIA